MTTYAPNLLPAFRLFSFEVRALEGGFTGEIDELLIDLKTGQVVLVLLSFHHFLDGRLFLLPWEGLTVDARHECFRLNVPMDKLEHAPRQERKGWPTRLESAFVDEIFRYYGYPSPNDGAVHSGAAGHPVEQRAPREPRLWGAARMFRR